MAIKLFNLKGDLFATSACFSAQAVIRLGSSMVLTRILNPDAYGIITVMLSIAFVIELLADTNVTLFIIRDERGEDPQYLNTAWTIAFARAVTNTVALFTLAPLISNYIYHLPALTNPLRVFALSFTLTGLQSMAWPIAIRRKNARIVMYSELASTAVSTVFSLTYCHYSRDYWGIIYGILLQRLIMSILSRQFFKDKAPKLQPRRNWGHQ